MKLFSSQSADGRRLFATGLPLPADAGPARPLAATPRASLGVSSRSPARPRHCLNYMPKGSGRWPLSEADLDVIADQRGERPGKTLNWGTPEQRLELLLRT